MKQMKILTGKRKLRNCKEKFSKETVKELVSSNDFNYFHPHSFLKTGKLFDCSLLREFDCIRKNKRFLVQSFQITCLLSNVVNCWTWFISESNNKQSSNNKELIYKLFKFLDFSFQRALQTFPSICQRRTLERFSFEEYPWNEGSARGHNKLKIQLKFSQWNDSGKRRRVVDAWYETI